MGRRLNQACPPCDAPSSTSSPDRRLSNARTADDRSSKDSRVNQSAKVVLDNPAQVDKVIEGFGGTARKHWQCYIGERQARRRAVLRATLIQRTLPQRAIPMVPRRNAVGTCG